MTYSIVLFQWLFALPVSILLAYFAFEVFLGLRGLRKAPNPIDETVRTASAVLVPAHNEATVIGDTVRALREAAPEARILVVADNCSDNTAETARTAGAEVADRHDDVLRGKGYALDFGRAKLASSPPDCVVIIDADCRITPGGVSALSEEVARTNGPVQAANLVVGNAEGSHQTAISNFAMMVKNLFRARGMSRIGGGALLFGTGMAFPWSVFEKLQLATGDATEDISLGLGLARAGTSVALADHIRVTSPPPKTEASRGQRTRWEHGFLKSMQTFAMPMLARGFSRGSRLQVAIGLHMLVPPLALLVALGGLALLVVAGLVAMGGSLLPVIVISAAFGLAALAIAGAWLAGGRSVLPAASVLAIPLYVIWKIPIYLAYLVKPNAEWNRTRRDGEKP